MELFRNRLFIGLIILALAWLPMRGALAVQTACTSKHHGSMSSVTMSSHDMATMVANDVTDIDVVRSLAMVDTDYSASAIEDEGSHKCCCCKGETCQHHCVNGLSVSLLSEVAAFVSTLAYASLSPQTGNSLFVRQDAPPLPPPLIISI